MTLALDIVAGALIIIGSVLALTAAIGIVRFGDTLSRMHPATKPQAIAMVMILCGAAIRLRSNADTWMLLLVALFTIVTVPVIAHMLGRVAYREQQARDGVPVPDDTD